MTETEKAAGRITSVEPDTRGAGAARVNVNGRWYCTIPMVSVAALGLQSGMLLKEPLRASLSVAADEQAAYRFILAALGRRGFARRDLERRLVQKGHPREAAQAAVARAGAAGLLDDRVYATSYVEAKAARGRGPARLLRDLFAMGVDRGVAEQAVAAAWKEDEAVVEASKSLALKRATQLGSLPRPVKRRRVLAYLARRGFSGREVREIVTQVVG